MLHDVSERPGVRNRTALRWLQRHLLGHPAGTLSVQKGVAALKSRGLPVGQNTRHEMPYPLRLLRRVMSHFQNCQVWK
ncbi:MAG: hypothetical protein WCQ21_23405 [Verrucomicrobiota bacterium]|jgi:hypothetical protein